MTSLRPRENNPLKFSPPGEVLRATLVGDRGGFLPLSAAIEEALQDVKAHEVATLIALEQAAKTILARFDPRAIEVQAPAAKGMFARGANPAARREAYKRAHAALADNLDKTARDLAAEAFGRAYASRSRRWARSADRERDRGDRRRAADATRPARGGAGALAVGLRRRRQGAAHHRRPLHRRGRRLDQPQRRRRPLAGAGEDLRIEDLGRLHSGRLLQAGRLRRVALGGDLVAKRELEIKPGEKQSFDRSSPYDTKFIAAIAGFRSIDKATWRASVEFKPGDTGGLRRQRLRGVDRRFVHEGQDPGVVLISARAGLPPRRANRERMKEMSLFDKPLWTDGLLIKPQHLQQQDRWVERLVAGRVDGLCAWGWGLRALSIDRDLLGLGKIAVQVISAVLPDGTAIDLPTLGEPPAPRTPPSAMRDALVKIAAPIHPSDGAEMADEASAGARLYPLRSGAVRPRPTAGAPLKVGRLNVRLFRGRKPRMASRRCRSPACARWSRRARSRSIRLHSAVP